MTTSLWAGWVRSPAHGPLPVLLLVLTAVTGVIDAVSLLALGRVFVANMTGNVVFLGLALAGAPGFSLAASAAALAGFLLGAFAGGAVVRRRDGHRGRLLRDVGLGELALVVASLVLIATVPTGAAVTTTVAGLLAIAMGLQNTAARKLAVPDLTTTVLTMTLTGIAADISTSGVSTIARRLMAVLVMFAGALVGTLLVLHAPLEWALGLAAALLAAVVLVAFRRSRHPEPWHAHVG